MAVSLLPPLIATLAADSTAFTAGMEEAQASMDQTAASIGASAGAVEASVAEASGSVDAATTDISGAAPLPPRTWTP